MSSTFPVKSLIQSEFQYFEIYQKSLKKSKILKVLRIFIVRNNNDKKLLTNCRKKNNRPINIHVAYPVFNFELFHFFLKYIS